MLKYSLHLLLFFMQSIQQLNVNRAAFAAVAICNFLISSCCDIFIDWKLSLSKGESFHPLVAGGKPRVFSDIFRLCAVYSNVVLGLIALLKLRHLVSMVPYSSCGAFGCRAFGFTTLELFRKFIWGLLYVESCYLHR